MRYPVRPSSSWSTGVRAPDRGRGGQPGPPDRGSGAARPGRPARVSLRTRDAATSGRAYAAGLDGPAREGANDRELAAAGVMPGDPSLYPSSLADLYGPAGPCGPRADQTSDSARRRQAERWPRSGPTELPPLCRLGSKGRIFVRPARGAPASRIRSPTLPTSACLTTSPTLAAELSTSWGPSDIFVVLFEYGPESLGQRLFARQGLPRSLATDDFRPHLLRRGLSGQSGTQWFFTEGRRPFTLYAVLGSHAQRQVLVPQVNALIGQLAISPGRSPGPTATAGMAPSAATALGGRWN